MVSLVFAACAVQTVDDEGVDTTSQPVAAPPRMVDPICVDESDDCSTLNCKHVNEGGKCYHCIPVCEPPGFSCSIFCVGKTGFQCDVDPLSLGVNCCWCPDQTQGSPSDTGGSAIGSNTGTSGAAGSSGSKVKTPGQLLPTPNPGAI